MTALLLHAITRADAPEPASHMPHHLRLVAGDLMGLARPVTPQMLAAEKDSPLEAVETHHTLLSGYAATSDLLPVRYGTAFSGENAIMDMLRNEATVHLARLQSIASCVEYTLKVLPMSIQSEEPAAPPRVKLEGGRAFLKRKQSVRDAQKSFGDRRAAFARKVLQQAGAIGKHSVKLSLPSDQAIAASALLVTRCAVPDLLAVLRQLANGASDCGITVSLRGPGPCYSFADQEPWQVHSGGAVAGSGRGAVQNA